MSGNHNMHCSGNQPDIVERLRHHGIKHPQQIGYWRDEAADEIERLRKMIDKISKWEGGGVEVELGKWRKLLSIEAAAKNLVDVKGRHHSEQAYKQLVEVLK